MPVVPDLVMPGCTGADFGPLTGGAGADALAARLATLELENQRKDAEIAALRGQSGGAGAGRPGDRPETPASTATGADDIAPGVSLTCGGQETGSLQQAGHCLLCLRCLQWIEMSHVDTLSPLLMICQSGGVA